MSERGRIHTIGVAEAHGLDPDRDLAHALFQGATLPLLDRPEISIHAAGDVHTFDAALAGSLQPLVHLETTIAGTANATCPIPQQRSRAWGIDGEATRLALTEVPTGKLAELAFELLDPKEIPHRIQKKLWPEVSSTPNIPNTELAARLTGRYIGSVGRSALVGCVFGLQLRSNSKDPDKRHVAGKVHRLFYRPLKPILSSSTRTIK